jgi:hypothetical protein
MYIVQGSRIAGIKIIDLSVPMPGRKKNYVLSFSLRFGYVFEAGSVKNALIRKQGLWIRNEFNPELIL